ncbi:probable multidrug resistance transporter, MFS superfamily [Saccharopolyspora erythraea NRRL 2338]|uniref:Major facilitator superfamily (MFS) profile domain-containing protein n=3 Tax=Saccharopolyspora erythraea TaxID=1836 RepID=A0ABN1DCG8_SACER|nr:MFS transporter [Saccharopolyspora erythraea D]QRK93473.1 MFS transporter [Saccharopolyspora erythraea]CAM01533.1 probable multidrug resistance transporter, MFS superfamily [Saccharopolyspora erythraea NRRL 2338]
MDAQALEPAGGRALVTLVVTCVATLLALMNYTAPMTVLAEVAAGLGAGLGGQTWILNGIALGLAALLLTAGSLADNHGRKRVFVLAPWRCRPPRWSAPPRGRRGCSS